MHFVFNVNLCLPKTKCIFMISYFRIVISIPLSRSSPGFSVYLHQVLSPRTHNIPSAAAVSLPVKLQNVDLSLEYTLQSPQYPQYYNCRMSSVPSDKRHGSYFPHPASEVTANAIALANAINCFFFILFPPFILLLIPV